MRYVATAIPIEASRIRVPYNLVETEIVQQHNIVLLTNDRLNAVAEAIQGLRRSGLTPDTSTLSSSTSSSMRCFSLCNSLELPVFQQPPAESIVRVRMEFEYYLARSEANLRKHGISLNAAQQLWDDDDLLEVPARSEDEPRHIVIGRIGSKHWSAVIPYRPVRWCAHTCFRPDGFAQQNAIRQLRRTQEAPCPQKPDGTERRSYNSDA